MRIAYISYEYPPDIGQGGIATYTYQVAIMMQERGHDVEVFCGSYNRNETEKYKSVLTHRILITNVSHFRKKVVEKFSERQSVRPFDIIESPEINGNGYEIKKAFPNIPLTVKLHTPAVLQIRILNTYVPLIQKVRFITGALLRGRVDLGYWSRHDKNQYNDIDYQTTQVAECISAPSMDMKKWAVNFWRIPTDKIELIPNPYLPDNRLLEIPIESNNGIITFHGKLNVHKGMVVLSEVIPKVLNKCPGIKFRLAGKDDLSHIKGVSMKTFLEYKLNKYLEHIEFTGPLSLDEIPEFLSKSDICVFPSIWDNFPLVCLEAMSAGRAIVAGNRGGMRDMLEETNAGILIDPSKPEKIASEIIKLIKNPEFRFELGIKARRRVLTEYGADIIGKKMEEIYDKSIQTKVS
jgi:glycogen synthase